MALRWKRLQPPWKPSSERIRIYRQLIEKYALGNKALVLDATPEVRDLLAKMKFKVTVWDFSASMVKAMTSLKKMKSQERIIIGDWLTTKLPTKYDLIIGDSAVCNLLPKEYKTFFQRINKLLKDDGIFICQNPVSAKPRQKTKISIQEIINKLRNRPSYYKNYLNSAYDYLQWSFFHTQKNQVNFGELNEIYRQKFKDGEIIKKEFKLLDFDWSQRFIVSFFDREEFKKILNQYWQIIEETYERKHRVHRDFYQIYVLEKKQYTSKIFSNLFAKT